MNSGISVSQIRRNGALYIAETRIRSLWKWRTIIAAVSIGNPLFYLISIGIGVGVLVNSHSGTSGTGGVKYIVFLAPGLGERCDVAQHAHDDTSVAYCTEGCCDLTL